MIVPFTDTNFPILQLAPGLEDLRGIEENLSSLLSVVFFLSGLASDKHSGKDEILKTKHSEWPPVEAVQCVSIRLALKPHFYPHQRG